MTKIKAILIVIAVALITVIAGGLIIHFARNGKGGGETESPNVTAQVDECVLQESIAFCGENFSPYSAKAMSATAYAATSTEEQVVSGNSATLTLKLTSTVLSEVMLEKVNVPVRWSLEFVNPNSTWASGKSVTNYVTATPKSDFTRTVTITNKEAFGEQIRLTATLENNSSKSASCVIDYVKRFSGGLQEVYCTSDFGDDFYAGGKINAQQEVVGTKTGELFAYSTYIELDSGFCSLLKSYLKFDIQLKDFSFSKYDVSTYINYRSDYKYYTFEVTSLDANGDNVTCDYTHFIVNWDSLTEAQKTAVKYAWWIAYQEYGNNLTLDLVFDYSYGGKALGQISGYLT